MSKRKPGSRRDKADRKRREKEALRALKGLAANDHGQPNPRILAMRERFSFVTPTKGPEGRVGTIDQDICDGIGQLHALGLLNGHGHEPQDMRDKAREWRDGYVLLMKGSGCKTSRFERRDKGHHNPTYGKSDAYWDRLDQSLTGYERDVLMTLLVDPEIGVFPDCPIIPWAQAFINEALLKRGKIPESMRFPDENDRAIFAAMVRGLVSLVDAGLPARHGRAAA